MHQRTLFDEPLDEFGVDTATEIVRKYFSNGLEELCDERFLSKRYSEFKRRDDPIYATLMEGMGDTELAKTFISYWTIGQTLSVKSRFWLEDAIFEIIRQQVTRFGKSVTHAYTQSMLSNGFLLEKKLIADIGEDQLEHLQKKKTWEVSMKRNALREADLIVGEQEREVVDRSVNDKPFQRRVWTQKENAIAKQKDTSFLKRMDDSITGKEVENQKLQCSLLIVEPDQTDKRPHVTAFRFINPKTFASHDKRKQERVNLLRLYAYLCQEKPFREPSSVKVYVTELLPRDTGDFDDSDSYPDYFSSETYLSSDEFWKRLGVPFSAVRGAISGVAKEFREKLITGLRKLLPDNESQR
ncbi:MAG: hypothetical protein WCI02_13225 [Planctomycetota bacterium]